MKYFTAERYLNLGNPDDERRFLAAHEQWEQAIADYRDHLKRIHKELPRNLWRLIESVYLHDARVLTMHQSNQDFFITLQPLAPAAQLIVLCYSLVEEPIIEQNVLPPERCREPIEWLYDELDLDRPEGPRGLPASSGKPTIRHNILLSNGWEVRLHFRSAWVKRPLRIIPIVTRDFAGLAPKGNEAGKRGQKKT
jgi:hypothetical protein